MFLTEEQAHTFECPHVRYLFNEMGVIHDKDSAIYIHQKCQASRCISWRWNSGEPFKSAADAEYRKSGKRLTPSVGYCGIAGRPEQ